MKVKIKGVDRMNNELISADGPRGSLKDVISLIILALIFIVIIIVVNIFLKPIILYNLNQEALEFLTAFDEDAQNAEIIEVTNIEGVTKVYKALDTGTIVADISIKGYGGEIRALVGIDSYGAVIGTAIVNEKETSGIGTIVFDDNYMLQYAGLSINDFFNYKYEDIQSYPVTIVAGSTITSKALSNIVYTALVVSETVK